MGSKAPNGYRITPQEEKLDPFQIVRDLEVSLLPAYWQLEANYLAVEATGELDIARFDAIEGKERFDGWKPILVTRSKMQKERMEGEKSGRRHPFTDFEFTIVFLQDALDYSGALYAMIYTEQEVFKEIWESYPGVEKYTDVCYEDDPEVEELIRLETWKRLLGNKVPKVAGLSWSLNALATTPQLTDLKSLVEENLPSFEDRAMWLAAQKVSVVEFSEDRTDFTLRDNREVAAEREAKATEILPLLTEVKISDLYGTE